MCRMVESSVPAEVAVVEVQLNDNVAVLPGQKSGALEQKSYENLVYKKKSLRARYAYGTIFLIMNLIAWFFRDYGDKILPLLQYSKACRAGHTGCFHVLGVLRVSLGCFIFFFTLFLTTLNTSKVYEARNKWHSGWWILKCVILIISVVIPFFIPSDYVQIYGEIARIGAGVFLVLQLISVIEFITWWNNYWMPEDKKHRSCSLGLFMSTIFYIASVFGIVLMYVLYASKPSCALNIFFISWTGVLLAVMMVISLHSKVNRGLLSSGIMASYIVFLCWSAIRSEPATAKCSPQTQESGHGGWTTVIVRVERLFHSLLIQVSVLFLHVSFLLFPGISYCHLCYCHGNFFHRNRFTNISGEVNIGP
ncbi:OLC1v1019433C2 [Oldenlandia corymbosa var. corymbosa]|uniref:OLC1v1019433C2 n=1 Tax=Oldenlandia corymbosa var. corymbosa TaxID=529605 RepID=A0AAV1EE24_OLDCO|nr:OLC1v1019433C2 [Oldenlandia corymbosa var. corymbosa]